MAPATTTETRTTTAPAKRIVAELKSLESGLVNPFYSPSADSTGDDEYKYANFKVM